VTTFQRGFPVKISQGSGNSLTALGVTNGTLRPDVVSGCHKEVSGSAVSRLGQWFNTNCFALAPDWGFGNESRVDASLRQQGINNFDFAVFKKTTIGERANIELRTEFFNIFNHPQFGPPNGTCCAFNPITQTGNKNFGIVTNTINNPRLIQFALKFAF
ncbi:MAG TPA: hypothetical protein VGV15_00340, partial [Terriglobales bacterium]|nr:hypothetical protein [Terriglobales bacterium]